MREMSNSIITDREYSAISQELARLKIEKKELNSKLNNNPDFILSFASVAEYTEWKEGAKQALQKNKERTEYLRVLAHTYLGIARAHNKEIGVYEKRQQRDRSYLTPGGIVELLMRARLTIEELTEQNNDTWRDADKILCGDLHALERRIRGDKVLNGWLSPQEAKEIRDRHETHSQEIAVAQRRETAMLNRTISDLQNEIKRLRESKGQAARVLERVYDGRYEEVDPMRVLRGYTHRIQLTTTDCTAIEDAIKG